MTTQTQESRHLHAVPETTTRVFADARAEQAVLGAMMLSPTVADQVVEIVRTADFHDWRHGCVFAVIVSRLAAGLPCDEINLMRGLDEAGELAKIGGPAYIAELSATVPVAASAPHYARIVGDWATRRRIREVAIRLDQSSADVSRDIGAVVDDAQRLIHEATVPRARTHTPAFGELVDDVMNEVFDPEPRHRGHSTGIGALDDAIQGLKPGQLIVVGARPGVGKSILTTGFARWAAMRHNIPSLVFSMEMTSGEIMRRVLAAEAGVSLTRILSGALNPDDRIRLKAKADLVREAPLRIDDTRALDLATLRATARRVQQRHDLGLVVVDYLQLMQTSGIDNRAQAIGEISRGLKILAGDLECPVVAAAQLNRLAEQRTDRRPQLSDLRESGSVEQDADVVIMLHRPDYQNPEHERSGEIDLIVAKNRNGPEETVTAAAQLHHARIVDFMR